MDIIPSSLIAIKGMIEDYHFVQDKIFPDEPSMAQHIQKHLKKMFVLACASCYETKITTALKTYSQMHSKKYKQKPHGFDYLEGISFFKLFDFGRTELKGAKEFLGPLKCFGKEFKQNLIEDISKDSQKDKSMKAFQEMCALRNSLAHNDLILADDAIEAKTFDNVMDIHDEALPFVDYIITKLSD